MLMYIDYDIVLMYLQTFMFHAEGLLHSEVETFTYLKFAVSLWFIHVTLLVSLQSSDSVTWPGYCIVFLNSFIHSFIRVKLSSLKYSTVIFERSIPERVIFKIK